MKRIEDHPTKGTRLDFRTHGDQVYHSGWERRDIVVKFAGRCAVCGRNVYQPTDESGRPYDPDPRGIFGCEHAAAHLVASEYGMAGADVALCFDCYNTQEKNERGLSIARQHWTEKSESEAA